MGDFGAPLYQPRIPCQNFDLSTGWLVGLFQLPPTMYGRLAQPGNRIVTQNGNRRQESKQRPVQTCPNLALVTSSIALYLCLVVHVLKKRFKGSIAYLTCIYLSVLKKMPMPLKSCFNQSARFILTKMRTKTSNRKQCKILINFIIFLLLANLA